MPSLTEQKSNLCEIIVGRVSRYLEEHPEQATKIALGATRRLIKRMTLNELRDWNLKFSLRGKP